MRLAGRIWIVVACALLLAACGAGDAPDPAGDPASSPASGDVAATAPAGEGAARMDIGEIVWAEEIDPDTGEPTDIVTQFTTESPSIIAVVEVNNLPEGAEFTATWTINGQRIDGTDMDITASEDLEHSWVVFRFDRDDGQRYPIGQLNVIITSSQGDFREGSVEIGFP